MSNYFDHLFTLTIVIASLKSVKWVSVLLLPFSITRMVQPVVQRPRPLVTVACRPRADHAQPAADKAPTSVIAAALPTHS